MAYFLCVELGPSAAYKTSRHRRNGNNMNDEEILAEFRAAQALLEGHFILSSGKRSANYLHCARVLMAPARAGLLALPLAQKLPRELRSDIGIFVSTKRQRTRLN